MLRNLSSGNEKTRELMRETRGLVQSLVDYLNGSLEKNKEETKVSVCFILPVQNKVCSVCGLISLCLTPRGLRMQCAS